MSKEHKDYWSEGGQIHFSDGLAWGISPDFQTICLGTEADILKALEQNIKISPPVANGILLAELKCRNKKLKAQPSPEATKSKYRSFSKR